MTSINFSSLTEAVLSQVVKDLAIKLKDYTRDMVSLENEEKVERLLMLLNEITVDNCNECIKIIKVLQLLYENEVKDVIDRIHIKLMHEFKEGNGAGVGGIHGNFVISTSFLIAVAD